jgi:hypothetical protein
MMDPCFRRLCALADIQHARIMSALPPKADIGSACRDVRLVPKADIPRCGAPMGTRSSPLAKHDGEIVRRHAVDLLQVEAFGGRKKRHVLKVTDAPFRILTLERLVEGFVAG